jgi:hypothetical protein
MNVIVMRRELTSEERAALQKLHPNEPIEAHHAEPHSAAEHLAECQRLSAQIVFLPHEQPIPTLAMQAGVKHLLLRDGQLLELVRVVPEFKPYVPG